MNWVDLLAIGLATAGIVDTWLNGEIFAGMRAEVDNWPGLLGQLLRCDFCMSRQLPFWLILAFYVPSLICDGLGCPNCATGCKLPIYFFAAGEIAWSINLIRGKDHGFTRTQIEVQTPNEPEPTSQPAAASPPD